MVDALVLCGLTYAVSSGLFLVSRKISFSRWARLNGLKINYGANPAEVLEKESILYFEIISVLLLLGGLAFEVTSLFVTYTNFPVVLSVNLPFLISVFILGSDSHVIDINGLIGVYPRGSVLRFVLAIIFFFVYPITATLAFGITGIIPPNAPSILIPVFTIPLAVASIFLFFPLTTDEWLFGRSNFVDALPSSMKTMAFRTFTPITLAYGWAELVQGNVPLLLIGFALCSLLAWGLSRIPFHDTL